MALESEYRIDVLDAFQALIAALQTAEEHICSKDTNLPAWFQPPVGLPLPPYAPTREQACSLIRQLEYLNHQKPREILVGAGILAASDETLHALQHLNLCKDRFKQAMLALKAAKIPLHCPHLNEGFESLLATRPNTTHHALRKMGLARLHLKQCYRRLPILLERPVKVSWTWANTRAITRITVEQAAHLLSKQKRNPNVANQLAKLATLNRNEPLAIVQELAPHLRANVVLPSEKNTPRRIMVKGPIPLFYRASDLNQLPDIRPPGEKQGRDQNRPVRSDAKLDPEPFLRSIRVHRYL